MKKHSLVLDIPFTLSECRLLINDISTYNFDDNHLCCPILEITPPGFNTAIVFNNNTHNVSLNWNFRLSLTACDLGLQTENCQNEFCALADGIYIIRYSISPNDIVYVEYNHLRTTMAMRKYRDVLCCVDLNKNMLGYEHTFLMKMLSDFRTYIDAAKALVEDCHRPDEGMALYNHALTILDKINCNYC